MVGFEPTTSPLSVECSNRAELHSPIVYYSVKGFLLGWLPPLLFLGVYVLYSRMVLMDFVLYMLRGLCVFVLCVFSTCFVYAVEPALRITEIMYDAEGGDEGKEFVEVVNVGSEVVDMTTVQFFERDDRPTAPAALLYNIKVVLFCSREKLLSLWQNQNSSCSSIHLMEFCLIPETLHC